MALDVFKVKAHLNRRPSLSLPPSHRERAAVHISWMRVSTEWWYRSSDDVSVESACFTICTGVGCLSHWPSSWS